MVNNFFYISHCKRVRVKRDDFCEKVRDAREDKTIDNLLQDVGEGLDDLCSLGRLLPKDDAEGLGAEGGDKEGGAAHLLGRSAQLGVVQEGEQGVHHRRGPKDGVCDLAVLAADDLVCEVGVLDHPLLVAPLRRHRCDVTDDLRKVLFLADAEMKKSKKV